MVGLLDFGGTETLLLNLLRTIDRNQFQFDFVEQTQKVCDYEKEILSLGSRIYRAPNISLTNLRTCRSWWRNFFTEHPEYQIVHGHSPGSAPIYMREAHRAGRIVIPHSHSSSLGNGLQAIVRSIWQSPLKRIGDYNFACSEDAGRCQYGENVKFQVVKNGIISKQFAWNESLRQETRAQFEIDPSDFVIGNVARFETPKNHLFLIRIFNEFHRLRPASKLLLVGGGHLEDQVRELVTQLKLENCVIFGGCRRDVNRCYQAMDAFLLPSLYEGLPLVLVEAQTSGLPCFASDKVVAPECKITDLMHFVPLEYSPEQWARIISETMKPEFQRQDHSAATRAAGFDIEDTADFLCKFYRKALHEHENN